MRARRGSGQDRRFRGGAQDLPGGDRTGAPRQSARAVRPGRGDGGTRRQQFRRERSRARPPAQRSAGEAWRLGQSAARAGSRAARHRALLGRPGAVGRVMPGGRRDGAAARRPAHAHRRAMGPAPFASKSGQPRAAARRRTRGDRGGRAGARARLRARSALLSGHRSCRSGRHRRRGLRLAGISDRRGGAQGPLQARAPAAGDARADGRTARRGGVAGAAGLHRRPAERRPLDPQRVSGPARDGHVGARPARRTRAAAASLCRGKIRSSCLPAAGCS